VPSSEELLGFHPRKIVVLQDVNLEYASKYHFGDAVLCLLVNLDEQFEPKFLRLAILFGVQV
jgi:hypothetical protein